jgi:GxxExxY protein
MTTILRKEESYQIIGLCYEVHNQLGAGFLEIVYKDALEYEFRRLGIPYTQEKEYLVHYKGIILPHKFFADFIVYNSIILEVKCVSCFTEEHMAQCLNYLKVSGNQLSLLVNFGDLKLTYKRIVLSKNE